MIRYYRYMNEPWTNILPTLLSTHFWFGGLHVNWVNHGLCKPFSPHKPGLQISLLLLDVRLLLNPKQGIQSVWEQDSFICLWPHCGSLLSQNWPFAFSNKVCPFHYYIISSNVILFTALPTAIMSLFIICPCLKSNQTPENTSCQDTNLHYNYE